MSAVLWEINGQAPQALGVRVARRDLVSFGASRVVLEIVDVTLAAEPALAWGAAVVITRSGATWFRGKVGRRSISRTPRGYSQSIEVLDAWWDLERLQQLQQWDGQTSSFKTLGVGGTIGESGVQIGESDYLSYASTGGELEAAPTVGEELAQLLGYAKYTGGVDFSPGTIEGGAPMWGWNVANRTTAEALQEVAAYSPNLVSYFDYGSKQLHIRALDALATAVTLAAGDRRITSARISPRDDLILDQVKVHLQQQLDGVAAVAATQTSTGDHSLTSRALEITLALPPGSMWDVAANGNLVDPESGRGQAQVPTGLSAALLAAYGRRYFEGDVTIKDDDVGGTEWMGKVLNITGGPAAWETMRAQIIGVSEDLSSGETTLSLGPGRQADAPQRAARNKPPVAPANRNNANQPPKQSHDPLETYLVDNKIYVAPGIAGLDSDSHEVIAEDTGPDHVQATIGLGGEVKTYLGISFQPYVTSFTKLDAEGSSFTEYGFMGDGMVLTAKVQTNRTSPAIQPPILNPATGEVTQNAVMYFLLGIATWPSGPQPQVQIIRKGNFDFGWVAPSRIYLRLYA